MTTCEKKSRSRTSILGVIALLWALLLTQLPRAEAAPVSESDVRKAALNWVTDGSGTFNEQMGASIREIHRFQGGHSGSSGYYLVMFEPKGWAVLPADDSYWPVPTFSGGSTTVEEFKRTMWYDITRYEEVPDIATLRGRSLPDDTEKRIEKNRERWRGLISLEINSGRRAKRNIIEEKNIRVKPLLGNERIWGQGHPFNKFTSFNQLTALSTINQADATPKSPDIYYPVGCVALSTSQVMSSILSNRQLYPTATASKLDVRSMGPHEFRIKRTPFNTQLLKREHNWDAIHNAFSPPSEDAVEFAVSDNDIQAIETHIAPLLRDIGVSSGLNYGSDYDPNTNQYQTGGFFSPDAIRNQDFEVAERIMCELGHHLSSKERMDLILPNLDFGMPVGVGITLLPYNVGGHKFDGGGHACVVDGYGYGALAADQDVSYETPYYHVSTGWGGMSNNEMWNISRVSVWSYDMAQSVLFSTRYPQDDPYHQRHEEVLFNLFPRLEDFIPLKGVSVSDPVVLSGRLVSKDMITGEPNADIRITWQTSGSGEKTNTATTNEDGIFAFVVDANSDIKIEVEAPDAGYTPIELRVGQNKSNTPSGNIGGVSDLIANRWLGDIAPSGAVVLQSIHDDIGAVLLDMGIVHEIVSQDRFISEEYVLPKGSVLFVEGGGIPHSSEIDIEKFAKIYTKILHFENEGGNVVMTENTFDLANSLMALSQIGSRFKGPGTMPIYGLNAYTVGVRLGGDSQAAVGNRDVKTLYNYPAVHHTILESLGNSKIHGLGFYVLNNGWNVWSEEYATMAYGKLEGGGYCYWSSHPLDKNYFENGEDAKKLVEFQINWILGSAGIDAAAQTTREIPIGVVGELNRVPSGNYEYKGGRGVFSVDTLTGRSLSSPALTADDSVRSRDIEIRKIGKDLLICMNGLSERVDFLGWYDGGSRVGSLIFADGTEWSASEIESRAVDSKPLRNLTLVQIENKIEGTEKDDTLTGTAKNDVFIPGAGDDTMIGVGGCNVYYCEPIGGNDTIINTGSTGIGGILRFHEDIVSTDMKVSCQGNDVLFTLSEGSVRVKDWYADNTAKLGRVEFLGDMTMLDTYDIELLAVGKGLISRDEYRDMAASLKVKPFDEYKAPEAEGKASGSGGGCNAGFASMAMMVLVASVLLIRRNQTR